jgi:hypothetical protein
MPMRHSRPGGYEGVSHDHAVCAAVLSACATLTKGTSQIVAVDAPRPRGDMHDSDSKRAAGRCEPASVNLDIVTVTVTPDPAYRQVPPVSRSPRVSEAKL